MSFDGCADKVTKIKVFRHFVSLPATVGIQPETAYPPLVPGFRLDHTQVVVAFDVVEMIHLADDWLASEYQRASDLIDASVGILR